MDSNGKSDPYVLAQIYPRARATVQEAKSKVVKKTLNPEFNETLTLELAALPIGRELRLAVLDYDLLSSAGTKNRLGFARVFTDTPG